MQPRNGTGEPIRKSAPLICTGKVLILASQTATRCQSAKTAHHAVLAEISSRERETDLAGSLSLAVIDVLCHVFAWLLWGCAHPSSGVLPRLLRAAKAPIGSLRRGVRGHAHHR